MQTRTISALEYALGLVFILIGLVTVGFALQTENWLEASVDGVFAAFSLGFAFLVIAFGAWRGLAIFVRLPFSIILLILSTSIFFLGIVLMPLVASFFLLLAPFRMICALLTLNKDAARHAITAIVTRPIAMVRSLAVFGHLGRWALADEDESLLEGSPLAVLRTPIGPAYHIHVPEYSCDKCGTTFYDHVH